MNLVSWNSALTIKKRARPQPQEGKSAKKLWCDVARPESYEELVGNADAVGAIEDWFQLASANTKASACLFVHGESGTGKSTTVSMIANKYGFRAVETYADQSRTPARLEGVVREAGVHGSRGVVILDDFEIFLSETTSLRVLSKLLRQLLGTTIGTGGSGSNNNTRCLFIIISNSKHKLFGALQDVSTIVRFERLLPAEMNRVFGRLVSRVRSHSYVPPMASYISSVSSAGTITQGIQQLQLLYEENPVTRFVPKPHRKNKQKQKQKRQKIQKIQHGSHRDCISYLWSDIYTHKILDHMLDDKFQKSRVIDRLIGFERGRLDIVGVQLHDEYARRMNSVQQLRAVAESISMADTNRIEVHEDGLYHGENRESWSENDICYVSFVACGVVATKGQKRRDQSWSRKPHTRLLKKSYEPLVL
ncbi:unnamed protein product [Ectocarpus sp. 12 AP-2014]